MVAPLVGAAAIGSAADIAGGFLTNRFNASQAQKQMNFQASSARDMMNFQERMSNTAWQRGIQDMRKAGVNPMLMVSQGGASSPAGVSAGGAMSSSQNPLAGAGKHISSALSLKLMQEQIDNIRANTDKQRSDADVNRVNARLLNINSATALNNNVVSAANAAEARNNLSYQNSFMGHASPYVQGVSNAIGGLLGLGGSGLNLIHSAKALRGIVDSTHSTSYNTKAGRVTESIRKRS